MKKSLFFAGLAAATLAFVGCNKEADVRGLDGVPVGIVLSNVDTRTVNDGMSTKWENGDALNVFYAVAGSTEYSANTKFEVDDAAASHATGTAELTAEAYDWYLLYPYSSYIQTPANTSNGYLTIGSASNGNQTQAGPDSMAHLAGDNLPVYGVARNVAVEDVPVVSMRHVASVVAVNLTNDTDKPLTVSTVSFTAPVDIVGTYFIDFSGDALAFKGSGDKYVSKTATLSVTGDESIAAGASAKFYIAIKPFEAKADDELKLTVLADQGEVEKTVTLTQAYSFASGSIKTLNLSYTAPVVIPTITVADIKNAITSTSSSKPDEFTGQLSDAVVTFTSGSNAFIQDETGGILLYMNGHGLKAGDVLNGVVSGKGYVYNGLKEMTSLTGFEKSSGSVPEAVSMTLAELLENYDRYSSVRVKVTGVTVPAAFTNRNTTMTDGDASLALRDQKNGLTIDPGKYDITGYPSYYNNPQFGVWTQDDIVLVASDVKFFGVSQNEFSVAADVTSVQVNVTGNVDWTVVPGDGITSVDPVSGSGEGVVTVNFPANTDQTSTKEYSLFIETADPGIDPNNNQSEITITQAKADASDVTTAEIDFSAQGYANQQEMTAVTINGISFTFDKGTNSNAPKYYTTGTAVRLYGSNSMTVSAGGKTIVSIELVFSSGEGTNEITTDVPTYAEPLWTGEATSVTFTVGGTSGHRRIKGVTVKYKGEAAPAATLQSIAVSGQKTVFTVGDTFTFDGTVTATYSDGSSKTVTPTSVSEPDMATAGTKEVTVSYTEGGVTKTAKYDITVNAAVVDGKTVSMTMTEYVANNNCTVSSGSAVTMYKKLQLNESVRMSTTGEDNCGSFWGTTTQDWRLYQNKQGNVIISVAEGCELKSVTLTFGVSNTGVLLDANGATVTSGSKNTVSGTSVTYTVGNSGTATNGQVKVTAVEVVYTGDGTTFPDDGQQTVIETKITMQNNLTVYLGETASLNASSNVEGAPISYESEDPTIASVDANGVVTGVAEGSVKVYARIAAVENQYTAAEHYCNVTVSPKPQGLDGTWEATALSAIADGAQFILVSTNSETGASFAMSNANGSSTAPSAVSVTVSGNKVTNAESNVVFVMKKDEGGYIFTKEGGETWVYVTNTNNGLRVGTGEKNLFNLDADSGYLVINDGTQNRYIGVYNNADWRSYTSVNNNIKGQTFTFFVKK